MTDAEIRHLEALADAACAFDHRPLFAEIRRLRQICADALPVVETALDAGLDFDEATKLLIIAEHATVKALRSALS